jgi:hypothetical protein
MQASLVIFTVFTRGNQQSVGGNMQPGPNAGSKAASITKILCVEAISLCPAIDLPGALPRITDILERSALIV